ncbi:MAG: tRNA (adenosine(37)-N6)-dimethylallyltransferase MiaA [Defluviitaleaceae bacterium]|nr:tRNA (adenosine(37)-N6)-dimethylallyltransferase MiaA [Defluviitaleaceae bacterium]
MKKIVVITGPTASGKSTIAENLKKEFNGELISADSMQVYKYMNIGTAKTPALLTDLVEPNEEFTVFDYVKHAKNLINNMDKLPIIVGGSSFYLHALLYDNEFIENIDIVYRKELEKYSSAELHEMLAVVDLETANIVHQNNRKRVIRALEFYKTHGIKISSHNEFQKKRKLAYNAKIFIVNKERKILYENINNRVDDMIAKGLVGEVKNLLSMGYTKELKAMQAIGYIEIIRHLEGQLSLEQAIDLIKQNTRKFAKRQLTWFKNKTEGIWTDDLENIIEQCKSF